MPTIARIPVRPVRIIRVHLRPAPDTPCPNSAPNGVVIHGENSLLLSIDFKIKEGAILLFEFSKKKDFISSWKIANIGSMMFVRDMYENW